MTRLHTEMNSGLGADTREGSVRQARDTPCDAQTARREQVIHCLICGTRWATVLGTTLWPSCDCDDRGPVNRYITDERVAK